MPEASKECECHTYWFFRFLLWSHMHRVHTGATVVLYTYICIMYVGQTLLYRIRFNFHGVKLLWFSRISSHPWRFHPTKTYTRLYFACLRLCNCKSIYAKTAKTRKRLTSRKLKRSSTEVLVCLHMAVLLYITYTVSGVVQLCIAWTPLLPSCEMMSTE